MMDTKKIIELCGEIEREADIKPEIAFWMKRSRYNEN